MESLSTQRLRFFLVLTAIITVGLLVAGTVWIISNTTPLLLLACCCLAPSALFTLFWIIASNE